MTVPALVPKPGTPIVTQGGLPGYETDAVRVLGLPWVMLDGDISQLKIRVSEFNRKAQRRQARQRPFRLARNNSFTIGWRQSATLVGHHSLSGALRAI